MHNLGKVAKMALRLAVSYPMSYSKVLCKDIAIDRDIQIQVSLLCGSLAETH